MNGSAEIYPPSPPGIPPGLARPGPAYFEYVVFVLFSLAMFLLVYVGLIVATVYLLWLLTLPLQQGWFGDLGILVLPWIVAVVFGLMLLVFLLKGLFRRGVRRPLYLEVREHDHPELFRFIRLLCQDTHAPLPRRVYLSPDVNAGVFYRESLLNLVFPVRKDLLIGLGLLNVLTLSEFKAVLAHEFGHFSQSSMKLGHYVYVVNPIIAHMVRAAGFTHNDDLRARLDTRC